MPKDKDLKRLVRDRMVRTGENYTTAHATLAGPASSATASDFDPWLTELALPDRHDEAYAALSQLPAARRHDAAIAGLDHESWRTRRSAARLLDDLDLTESSIRALTAALADPHPRVRRAALHTLICAHCKPQGCPFDPRPILERMAADRSRLVRETVLGPLTWRGTDDWTVRMLEAFAQSDPSPRLQEHARRGLERVESMRALDQRRQDLPAVLRAVTERHAGKWVAVANGSVVAAGPHLGSVRRALRSTDGVLYWVDPDSPTRLRLETTT
jgi:hypothetical protein